MFVIALLIRRRYPSSGSVLSVLSLHRRVSRHDMMGKVHVTIDVALHQRRYVITAWQERHQISQNSEFDKLEPDTLFLASILFCGVYGPLQHQEYIPRGAN